MHFNLFRNPDPQPLNREERIFTKKHLCLQRFLQTLDLETLQEIADNWINPDLKRVNSKRKLVTYILAEDELVDNAVASLEEEGTILFTLQYLASQDDIERLLNILDLKPKRNSWETNRAILDSLKLITTAEIEEIAPYRASVLQHRKEQALVKARAIRSEKAVAKRKIRETAKKKTQALKKRQQKQQVVTERKLQRKQSAAEAGIALVADYYFKKEQAEYQGNRLTMRDYARQSAIRDYPGFTRKVKNYKKQATKLGHEQFLVWRDAYEQPLYKEHVAQYLAEKEFYLAEGILSRKEFAEKYGLDYKTFSKYWKMYQHDADVRARQVEIFRDLEANRLKELRAPEKTPTEKAWEHMFLPKEETLPVVDMAALEQVARTPLIMKRGLPVFSDDPTENNARMELWLAIADDVMQVGLIDAVAEKYMDELNLPDTLTPEQKKRLILIQMKTVLQQLDVFDPTKEHLTFSRLLAWKEGRDAKKAKKAEKLAQKQELESELISLPLPEEEEVYDEAWLLREIERENAEARRYLTTPEEKERRIAEGLIYTEELPREKIEEIKAEGAIYENGTWLLPDQTMLDELVAEYQSGGSQLAGWDKRRRPRLLIGIGSQDYTKPWMHRFFEIRTVKSSSAIKDSILAFQPDAMMVYVSSTGSSFHKAIAEAAKESNLPLIIFDKGFSDAVQSAERQDVLWFVDAFNKQRTSRRLLRRRNPYYRFSPYAQPRYRHYRRRRFR